MATNQVPTGSTAKPQWHPPPGSWKCPGCANINYPQRPSCNRCHMIRADSTTVSPSANWLSAPPVAQLAQLAQLTQPASTGFQPPLGSWRCPNDTCKNINFPQRTHCNRCGAAQPTITSGSVKTPPAAKMKPGSWVCPKMDCGNINFPFRDSCNRCNTVKPTDIGSTLFGYAAGAPRTSSASSTPAALNANAAGGLTDIGSILTQAMATMPAANAAAPVKPKWTPPPGSWRCTNPGCGNVNFAARSECNRCHQPRATPTATTTTASIGGGAMNLISLPGLAASGNNNTGGGGVLSLANSGLGNNVGAIGNNLTNSTMAVSSTSAASTTSSSGSSSTPFTGANDLAMLTALANTFRYAQY